MKIITVSYSELSTARQCGLKHYLQYIQRWSKPTTGARSLGTRWHKILAAHYGALQRVQQNQILLDKAETWSYDRMDRLSVTREVAKEFALQPDDDSSIILQWMYDEHLKKWGYQPHWTIQYVEKSITVPLPRLDNSDIQFQLKVIIDLVVTDLYRRVYVIDHKTSKVMMSGNYLSLMDQFGLYDWALSQCGIDVFQNIIQFQKTTKYKESGKDYCKHFPMGRTERELEQVALDAVRTAYQVYTWPFEQLGEPPSHPNPEMCARMCDFIEAHLSARQGLASIDEFLLGTGFNQDHAMVDPEHRKKYEPEEWGNE